MIVPDKHITCAHRVASLPRTFGTGEQSSPWQMRLDICEFVNEDVWAESERIALPSRIARSANKRASLHVSFASKDKWENPMSTINAPTKEHLQRVRITAIMRDVLAAQLYRRKLFPLASELTNSQKVGHEPFDDTVSNQ